jgi:heme exporter protein A
LKTGVDSVEARRIVKRFGATTALRGVSVTFERGLTLVLGANGSGKSTLLGVVGLVLKPTSGEVTYQPMGISGPEARRWVGWVSHETLAYQDLSGRQNIELVAEVQGMDPRQAWEAAKDRFDLGTFAERPLRTNSRGQRQRIALARALVHSPGVVLLDEPTTGLDPRGVERLLAVVQEEVQRGAVLLVVAHDPEVFKDVASRSVRLERGKVADAT